MRRASILCLSAILPSLLSAGCSPCESVQGDFELRIEDSGSGTYVEWDGGPAVGLVFGEFPYGYSGDGALIWAIRSLSDANTIESPVSYGVVPEGAQETAFQDADYERFGTCTKVTVFRLHETDACSDYAVAQWSGGDDCEGEFAR